MRGPAALVAGVLLATGTPATADYVLDPKDLPEGYACEPDWDAATCAHEQRVAAWNEKYGDKYDVWLTSLLFDVNLYFAEDAEPLDEAVTGPLDERLGHATPNLVDAVYTIALRRYRGWAFAIDRDAQMRMVRLKDESEVDPAAAKQYEWWAPTSLAETGVLAPLFWTFEEADLTQCKAALEHLRAFPMQRGAPLWSERELGWLSGKAEPEGDGIIITADGDGVFVRARGEPDRGRPPHYTGAPFVIYDQSNRGEGYEWAKEMAKVARPCLKPSTATPPWEKLLGAEREKTSQGD